MHKVQCRLVVLAICRSVGVPWSMKQCCHITDTTWQIFANIVTHEIWGCFWSENVMANHYTHNLIHAQANHTNLRAWNALKPNTGIDYLTGHGYWFNESSHVIIVKYSDNSAKLHACGMCGAAVWLLATWGIHAAVSGDTLCSLHKTDRYESAMHKMLAHTIVQWNYILHTALIAPRPPVVLPK